MSGEKRQPKAYLACYLVLIRRGKVLLSRRANTGHMDGNYSMIAGHLEDKETVYEAMAREAKEEGGLALDPKRLKVVHILHRLDLDREYVDFFVQSDTQDEPRNMEPQKCDRLDWFSIADLPEDMVPYVLQAIEEIENGRPYSEYIATS